jgi:hypothetical protein
MEGNRERQCESRVVLRSIWQPKSCAEDFRAGIVLNHEQHRPDTGHSLQRTTWPEVDRPLQALSAATLPLSG